MPSPPTKPEVYAGKPRLGVNNNKFIRIKEQQKNEMENNQVPCPN